MSIRRIIFWQPFASPHQEAFLEAVAEQFSGEVILGVERPDLPPERVAQGWLEPQHVRVRVIDISKPENHAALSTYRSAESLHVFTGFFSHPHVWAAFRELADSQAKLAIYSEAPEQPPLTGWIKRLRGKILAARSAGRFAFVLAVGGVGCKFFEVIGFPRQNIIPFGYFLPFATPASNLQEPAGGSFKFVSAGQLVHRKGIDILIDACALLPSQGWHLDIYGDGADRGCLIARAASRGLSSSITFHGTFKSNSLTEKLASADCVVLPSRFDGWGAIVSESLGVGTPAICTTACGVAAVVNANPALRSRTCEATVNSLCEALIEATEACRVTPEVRRNIRDHAWQVLSPSRAAMRFLALAG